MRGTTAKRLRRYVRTRYKFLADMDLYRRDEVTGQIRLAEQCKKALYKTIKRNYKRKRKEQYV